MHKRSYLFSWTIVPNSEIKHQLLMITKGKQTLLSYLMLYSWHCCLVLGKFTHVSKRKQSNIMIWSSERVATEEVGTLSRNAIM